jgi:hypothetical protein
MECIEETNQTYSDGEKGKNKEKDENIQVEEDVIEGRDVSNIPMSENSKEQEKLWKKIEKEMDAENKVELSLDEALKLWLQRFVSIFYLPGIMSMVK